jgi:hypothetical protein
LTERIRRAPWHSPRGLYRVFGTRGASPFTPRHAGGPRFPGLGLTDCCSVLPPRPLDAAGGRGPPRRFATASLCIPLSGDTGLSATTRQHSGFGATTACSDDGPSLGWSAARMDGPVAGRRDVTPRFPRVTPEFPVLRRHAAASVGATEATPARTGCK